MRTNRIIHENGDESIQWADDNGEFGEINIKHNDHCGFEFEVECIGLDTLYNIIKHLKTTDDGNTVEKNMYDNAPLIIYTKLCGEIVRLAQANPKKIPTDIPETTEIYGAIDVLQRLYPQLKP